MNVHTVTGAIDVKDLGIAIAHEHLLFDLSGYIPKQTGFHNKLENVRVTIENLGMIRRDALLSKDNVTQMDPQLAIDEVMFFKKAGGKTIVDCTTLGLGRDVLALRRISEATGINIVAGAGFYIDRFHPSYVKDRSTEELAAQIVSDLQVGVDDTGVQCGIIGEIGTSWPITTNEMKVLHAAVLAQHKTNAPINIHPDPYEKQGHQILDALEKEGADLSKVVMSHTDACGFDKEYHVSLAERGCYVEFDAFGSELYYDSMGTDQTFPGKGQRDPTDIERIAGVCELIRHGYVSQLLLSHDTCVKMQLRRFGGYGYDHILTNIVPFLKRANVTDDELNQMLIVNPSKMLGY